MNNHLFYAACVAAATVSLLSAQNRIRTIDGDSAGDQLGLAVRHAGDVDGDGVPDFIVGAPLDDDNGAECGSALVLSGADGSVIHRFVGAAANYRLGTSVSAAGDVNGDGYADVIVGSIGDDNGGPAFGSARVYSGVDGTQLHEFFGSREFTFFGQTVRAAGDVDADGFDDVIVGVSPLIGTGNAFVYSGRDGSLIHQFLVLGIGEVVDGAGDVDGDGLADVVVGRPNDETGGLVAGSAAAFSGRDRSMLWQVQGAALEQLGSSVAGVGDVNRDGFDDVAVGAIEVLGGGAGYVLVISGADGSTLYTLRGANVPDQFGTSIAGVGDIDGDGVGDIAVGAPSEDVNGMDSGAARLFSGATGALIGSVGGDSAGDRLGTAVGILGDTTGDGFAELIVGAPEDDDNGADAGRAFVYDIGFTGTPGRERHYGRACPSSNGNLPRIDHRGDSALGADLEIRLRGAIPTTATVLNLGNPVNIPLDPFGIVGCTIYADPAGFNHQGAVDADGLSRSRFTIPPTIPALVGLRLDFQWVVLDPGANSWGVVLSNALAVTFGA